MQFVQSVENKCNEDDGKSLQMACMGMFGIDSTDDLIKSLKKVSDALVSNGFVEPTQPTLFRYRPAKYAVDEIAKEYLYMCEANSMSDPYDSLFSISKIVNPASEEQEEMDEFDQEFLEELDSFTPLLRDILELCCFSAINNSFPMWDHYANGHRGVCIEYDVSKLKSLGIAPLSVKYSETSFEEHCPWASNDFEQSIFTMMGCILTKNVDYSYEREWRCMKAELNNIIHIPGAIRRVYLGTRCKKYRKQIINACHKHNIEVVQMKASDREFSFDAIPID